MTAPSPTNAQPFNEGIGFGCLCIIATLAMGILKVTGILNLHWLVIFCPIWFPTAGYLFFTLLFVLGIYLRGAFNRIFQRGK